MLDVVFLVENQFGVGFALGFQQKLPVVLAWVFEAVERTHFVPDIAIAWCIHVVESRQDDEIDLVGSMGVRRVGVWTDVRRVMGSE